MGTLIISPGVRILIAPDYPRRGNTPALIDVAEDIIDGSITVAPCSGQEGGSTLSFTLLNNRRKYDGVFTPGDRWVIYMKRIRWLKVMSGYLTSVPYFGVYAPTVALSGQCRISKKFMYSLYDPGSVAFDELMLDTFGEVDGEAPDTGLADRLVTVIESVTGLPRAQMHVGGIPSDWASMVDGLLAELDQDLQSATSSFAASNLVAGESLANLGTVKALDAAGQLDLGPLYGGLPYTSASVLVNPEPDGFLPVSGSGSLRSDDWTVAIRIPTHDDDGPLGTPADVSAATLWWRDRKMLIVNEATNKAVVAKLVAWGPPSSTAHSIALSQLAATAIGAVDDTRLLIRFAKPEAPLGPAQSSPAVTNQTALPPPTGTTQVTADGLTFIARPDNGGTLQPNATAAWQFLQRVWPTTNGRISGYRASGSVPNSLHPRGLALDIGTANGGGTEPTDAQVAFANSIVWWFAQNPNAFGLHNIIWNNQVYDSSGVRPYSGDGNNAATAQYGHRDHIHIGFRDTQQRSIGPMGSPWPVQVSDFLASSARSGVIAGVPRATTVGTPDGASIAAQSSIGLDPLGNIDALTSSYYWTGSDAIQALSDSLLGPRILMNDKPFMPLAAELFGVAMREWGTAPNGDLLAWFPDYHNLYGTCARFVLEPIELEAFSIQWSDANMTTHQFVVGSWGTGYGVQLPGQALAADRRLETRGIVTVEQPSIMEALLNLPREGNDWTDPTVLLSRFGPRVNVKELSWAATPRAEFWHAVDLFRRNWAAQFTCSIKTSFLPEIFPGMILQIPAYGIQFYVRSISHSWNLSDGGSGFSTAVNTGAPSTIGTSGPLGLPRGGAWIGADNPGPAPTPGAAGTTEGGLVDSLRGLWW